MNYLYFPNEKFVESSSDFLAKSGLISSIRYSAGKNPGNYMAVMGTVPLNDCPSEMRSVESTHQGNSLLCGLDRFYPCI